MRNRGACCRTLSMQLISCHDEHLMGYLESRLQNNGKIVPAASSSDLLLLVAHGLGLPSAASLVPPQIVNQLLAKFPPCLHVAQGYHDTLQSFLI